MRGSVGMYDAEEAGRHWVRPREITYEMGEAFDYVFEINVKDNEIGEAVVFGYPQPGKQANKYVSLAAAKAVAATEADGIYITNYTVDT